MIAFKKISKPHSPLEKAQVHSGLGPFGCPEPSFWSWETSTARRRRPFVDVWNGIEKRDWHFSVGKASSASRQLPLGCLDTFVSVGGPQGRSVVAEKEKGNVD